MIYSGDLYLPSYPGTQLPPRYPTDGRGWFPSGFLAPIRPAVPRPRVRLVRARSDASGPQWFTNVVASRPQFFPAQGRRRLLAWSGQARAHQKREAAGIVGKATRIRSRETPAGPVRPVGRPHKSTNFGALYRSREASAPVDAFLRDRRALYPVPRFGSLNSLPANMKIQVGPDGQRSFSPRAARAEARKPDIQSTPVPGEGRTDNAQTSAPFDRFRTSGRSESTNDAMGLDATRQALNPAPMIDTLELDDWLNRYLERQTMRPPVSMTGSDPRLTPLWAGPSLGF